ncbi:MAG: DEAD/DEAH box helicase [Nitrososphaerota archaeon]|jgi:SNF2 family DNA or RNA helicase|nr:DEAD/DEAH box helicase [Nitrososphaerota archaeon]
MPDVRIQDAVIIIKFDAAETQLASQCRMTLGTIIGFSVSPGGLQYEKTADSTTTLYDIVRRVNECLQKRCTYTRSPEVNSILSHLEESKRATETALNGSLKREWIALKPERFTRTLMEYQIEPVEHMVSVRHAANFSVPGSGKTTIAYAAFSALKSAGEIDKMLVVCPTSAFQPWEAEWKECFGTPAEAHVKRITGSPSAREDIYRWGCNDPEVFLISYDTLRNDLRHVPDLISSQKTMLVLDESHKIKSAWGAKANACLAVSRTAKKRVILTGTPVPNTMEDFWMQFTFLYPDGGVLGNLYSYKAMAGENDESGRVRELVRPFYRRIKKSDLNLPTPLEITVPVPMGRVQEQIYGRIVGRILEDLENQYTDVEAGTLMAFRRAALIRMMQAASNPSLLLEKSSEFNIEPYSGEPSLMEALKNYSKIEVPPKFLRAAELARSNANRGQKTIIWSNFIKNVEAMTNMLSDLGAVAVFGGLPLSGDAEGTVISREGNINRFKEDPTCMVLVANPAACAESISLHKTCHNAVYLDRTYNAGHFIQSKDRIHRIGLPPGAETTYEYLCSAPNTIDERIHESLGRKERRLNLLMDDDFSAMKCDFDMGSDGRLKHSFEDDEFEGDFEAAIEQAKRFYGAQKT